jgi:hypothetical protein
MKEGRKGGKWGGKEREKLGKMGGRKAEKRMGRREGSLPSFVNN